MAENLKVAFIFPGQGSQEVGMGKRLYETYASARKVFDTAGEVLGFSLASLCFNGPEEDLIQTINVQPAILTTSIACLEAAREIAGTAFPRPSFVAGHSVGEYAALVANGMLGFRDAIALVRTRGRLMQEAGQKSPGAMAAMMGADENIVRDVCDESGTEISNINSAGQTVISGSVEGIARATAIAESKGIRRVRLLKVSGAFHSRLMQPAAEGLRAELRKVKFSSSSIPLISNVTGNPITDPLSLPDELSTQVISCVQWQKSVENMAANGAGIFIEFGHGQVVNNLVKRIAASARVYNVGDVDTESQINVIITETK
jgi:[acyl-carrier-protein] S-malonyltransferase